MNKTTVAILFGGQSAEHEVSLRSAQNIIDAINTDSYALVLVRISKEGIWQQVEEPSAPKALAQVAFVPGGAGQLIDTRTGQELDQVDVVLPVLHGPYGEDGTIQGVFEIAGVPYVGSGVLGSAVGMDKDVMKRLLREAGIPIGPYQCLRAHEETPSYQAVSLRLGAPLYIKPANMGSSVGVSRASNENEYHEALREAFRYDRKIIIEQAIEGRELECAVVGNTSPEASVVGEVLNEDGFYSYEEKYSEGSEADIVIPADIPAETQSRIQEMALQVYATLECQGLGRVDCFLTPAGEILINEINTFPGFTSISMYPALWEASGRSYTELIDTLVESALEEGHAQ